MLESNPSRNSQLETYPKDERGRCALYVGASIIRRDFLMPSKLIKQCRRVAASFLTFLCE